MSWLRRLRQEWPKNEGKPREEWAPGRDLRETVLIAGLGVVLLGQIGLFVWWVIGLVS